MAQDHKEFELVVVNDRSDDDTWEILQNMQPLHHASSTSEYTGR
ncbi:MAG: glycosyltransferase [Flavobacteriales bacterium]|nr:glycosyltransferase [Flavobacteriales bacterium]